MQGPETETIAAQAAAVADPNGMCEVRAMIDGVRDNGKTYRAGQTFHVHKDLVPAHVIVDRRTGSRTQQVELVNRQPVTGNPEDGAKAQGTPADKQAVPKNTK